MVRCVPCWKVSKNIKATPPSSPPNKPSSYQAELQRLRQEIDSLRNQLSVEQHRARTAYSKPTAIPEEMIGRLIRLAHPDRHNNSEASNKATAWLLSQRKVTRRS